MSVDATTWVWENSKSSGNARLVLLAIADHADHYGANAWPTVGSLASMARLSVRTVQRMIVSLVESGELEVTGRAGGSQYRRADRRPNLYRLVRMGGENDPSICHPVDPEPPAHGVTVRAPRGDTAVPITSFKNVLQEQEQKNLSEGVADAPPPAVDDQPEEESVPKKTARAQGPEELALFDAPVPAAPEPEFTAKTLVAAYVESYARHHDNARPGGQSIARVGREAKSLIADSGWTSSELIKAADDLGATPWAALERQAMMARRSARGPSKIIPHGDQSWTAPTQDQARQAQEDEFMSAWLAERANAAVPA